MIDASDLEAITVSPDNPVYYASRNCLIEKKTNKLVLGCSNSIIPDSAEIIGEDAFNHALSLKEIRIGKNVKYIRMGAFYDLPNLERIEVDKDNAVFDSREDCNAIIITKENLALFALDEIKLPKDVTLIKRDKMDKLESNKVSNYYKDYKAPSDFIIPDSDDLEDPFDGGSSFSNSYSFGDFDDSEDFPF